MLCGLEVLSHAPTHSATDHLFAMICRYMNMVPELANIETCRVHRSQSGKAALNKPANSPEPKKSLKEELTDDQHIAVVAVIEAMRLAHHKRFYRHEADSLQANVLRHAKKQLSKGKTLERAIPTNVRQPPIMVMDSEGNKELANDDTNTGVIIKDMYEELLKWKAQLADKPYLLEWDTPDRTRFKQAYRHVEADSLKLIVLSVALPAPSGVMLSRTTLGKRARASLLSATKQHRRIIRNQRPLLDSSTI